MAEWRSASFRFVSPLPLSRESVSLSLSLFMEGRRGRYACSSFRRGYCGNNGDINIPRRGAFSPRCKNVSPPPFLPSFLPLLLQISFGGIMRPRILLFLRPFFRLHLLASVPPPPPLLFSIDYRPCLFFFFLPLQGFSLSFDRAKGAIIGVEEEEI